MTFKFFEWWNSRGGVDEKKGKLFFFEDFWCEAFVHIDKENRTKLEEKSKKCTFIGYTTYSTMINPKLDL